MGNWTTDTNISYISNNSTDNNPLFWTPISSFIIFILISGISTNLSVILLFLKNASLRTPFTIYLVNLLLANMMCSVVYYPFELLNNFYAVWWTGSAVCTFYQYVLITAQSAMCSAHALIALNRLWAVTFPISYRQHHKNTAVTVCVAMWIFVHVCLLPGLVLDALFYRLPEETNGCLINSDAMRVYWIIIMFVSYNGPELIVITAYFAICYKTIRRHQRQVHPSVALSGRQSTVGRSVKAGSANTGTLNHSGDTDQRRPSRFLCWKIRKRNTQHGFLMLTLMTLTIFICYTPENVYYTVWAINQESMRSISGLYVPAVVLFEMTAVLDPIWFILALPDFRQAFRRTYLSL